MHVFRFKGNNSGIHVQAWLLKKDESIIVAGQQFLHYLKLRYKAHLFPFLSCISRPVVVYLVLNM